MEITKCFIVDDDPIFCSGLAKIASNFGISLDTFHSPLEFEGISSQKYAAGIIDIDLGPVQGPELANYVGALFGNCPIMYISSMEYGQMMLSSISAGVRNFVSKSQGFRRILGETMKLINDPDKITTSSRRKRRWDFNHKGIILIDDDKTFQVLMKSYAEAEGIPMACFSSLMELGSFANIGEYDVAIIDYFLEGMKGHEIAEYFSVFFPDRPVVVVSADDTISRKRDEWPKSVKAFMPKSKGAANILKNTMDIFDAAQYS